jgi:hypothetical protein
MSEQPDLHGTAMPRSQKKVHNIVLLVIFAMAWANSHPFYFHAFSRPNLCYFHLLASVTVTPSIVNSNYGCAFLFIEMKWVRSCKFSPLVFFLNFKYCYFPVGNFKFCLY